MTGIGDLNITMRRHWIDQYLAREAGLWPAGLKVLDVGGTRIGKRGFFDIARYPLKTFSVNIAAAKRPDSVADGGRLPFAKGTFDAVICTETLEHVYEPRCVVAEIERVLRPGGRLLLTVPFMVGVHADPDDFARFTASFWSRSLEEAGFSAVRIEPQGYLHSVMLDMLRNWTMKKRNESARPMPLVRTIEKAIAAGRRRALRTEAPGADVRGRMPQYTTGYGIAALKAGGATP